MKQMDKMTPSQIAKIVGLHPRTIQLHIKRWRDDLVRAGVVQISGGLKAKRYYVLDFDGFLDVLEKKGIVLMPVRER